MTLEGLLIILVVGAIAGWLAGQIMRGTGFGLIWDIVIGLAGALLGGWLLPRLGIVIGGSGNGEQIAANKVKGVRAALAWSEETAKLGREHNNANVLSVGGRMHTEEEATKFIEIFLATPYSNEERHTRRIDMLSAYETTGELPAIPAHHPQG